MSAPTWHVHPRVTAAGMTLVLPPRTPLPRSAPAVAQYLAAAVRLITEPAQSDLRTAIREDRALSVRARIALDQLAEVSPTGLNLSRAEQARAVAYLHKLQRDLGGDYI